MGAVLFRWRLAVIVGAFGLAALWAAIALRVDTHLQSLIEIVGVRPVFVVTAPVLIIAFLLRVTGEARLGAAVYGQQASARVVSGGPFRFSRHPLYVGTWLFFVAGCAPFTPPAVLGAIAVAFAIALRAIGAHEERALAEKHGDAWTAYVSGKAVDDGIVLTPRDWMRAVAGNLFFLSLALYRIGIAIIGDAQTTPGRVLGVANLLCLLVWLVVVAARRLRG